MKSTLWICLIISGLLAGPIEDLQPRNWYQVPNSRMDAFDPCPADNCGYTAVQGLDCVMGCWNGGVFDSQRDRLIVWGGGHNGYCGNEVYAFSLNSLSWARIWGPSQAPAFGGTHESYADGSPGSRHTYDNLAYDPARDVLFSNDGSLCWTGYGGVGTWEFRFSSNTWSRRQDVPGGASIFTQTGYDPVTGHCFVRNNSYITEYNPSSNSWTNRSTAAGWGDWQVCGEIDPGNRIMVLIGGGKFNVFNLSTYSWTSPAVTGDTEINGAYAPGLAWDSRAGKLVAWGAGGNGAVYVLHVGSGLSSFRWEKITPLSSTVPTGPQSTGTYGRFQYCPSKNVFVVVNRVTENVFIYRLDNLGNTAAEFSFPGGSKTMGVFPNPCRERTAISLPRPGLIFIFNVSGRRVKAFPGERETAVWNAEGNPAGVYFVRAWVGGLVLERKMVLCR